MIREVIKRFLTLTLCVLMLCAVMPINAVKAYAATSVAVPVADLGATYESSNSDSVEWSVKGNEITGTVKATTGCSTSATTTTLTLTNQKNTAATLAFDYELSIVGGTIMVDGSSVTASASFNKTIDAGGTIEIVLSHRKPDNKDRVKEYAAL